MKETDQIPPDDLSRMQSSIDSLQSRIELLESKMASLESSSLSRYITNDEQAEVTDPDEGETRKGIESIIGEDGFAWISSIILIFFVVFLMVLFQKTSGSLAATISGLAATGGVYLLTLLLRKRFSGQVNRINTGILCLRQFHCPQYHDLRVCRIAGILPVAGFAEFAGCFSRSLVSFAYHRVGQYFSVYRDDHLLPGKITLT